jgi:hypothetical protein
MSKRDLITAKHAACVKMNLAAVARCPFSRPAVIKNLFAALTWQPGEQRARE